MNVRIDPIRLGISHCFLLRGEGTILIDAGTPGQAAHFRQALQRLEVAPQDVRLIVLTHAHADHAGSAQEISALTGAPIAVHAAEHAWLEQGKAPLPPGVTGWGKALMGLMGLLGRSEGYPPVDTGFVLNDDDFALAAYGIAGSIVYTPGHTRGSVSVVLEGGEALVGDLAMAAFPLRLTPGMTVLAEDWPQVLASWHMLLARGVTTIYPAHGKPFPAEVIRKALDKAS